MIGRIISGRRVDGRRKGRRIKGRSPGSSTAVLAYIGDAVYEVQVRKHVFRQGLLRPERLHLAAVHDAAAWKRRPPPSTRCGTGFPPTSRRWPAGKKSPDHLHAPQCGSADIQEGHGLRGADRVSGAGRR